MTELSSENLPLLFDDPSFDTDAETAATMLGVGRTRLSQMTSRGELGYIKRKVGGRFRLFYRQSDLVARVAERYRHSFNPPSTSPLRAGALGSDASPSTTQGARVPSPGYTTTTPLRPSGASAEQSLATYQGDTDEQPQPQQAPIARTPRHHRSSTRIARLSACELQRRENFQRDFEALSRKVEGLAEHLARLEDLLLGIGSQLQQESRLQQHGPWPRALRRLLPPRFPRPHLTEPKAAHHEERAAQAPEAGRSFYGGTASDLADQVRPTGTTSPRDRKKRFTVRHNNPSPSLHRPKRNPQRTQKTGR